MVDNAYSRNLQPPRESFFLFGLRGVGKSTWARQRFAKAMHVNLLDEGVYHSFLRDPSRFAEELRGRPRGVHQEQARDRTHKRSRRHRSTGRLAGLVDHGSYLAVGGALEGPVNGCPAPPSFLHDET